MYSEPIIITMVWTKLADILKNKGLPILVQLAVIKHVRSVSTVTGV
jgi:hypothetical protein